MTVSKLVSEARPIPWDHLSVREQDLLAKEADPWISEVISDAGLAKVPAGEIDVRRNGRVLFIDGQRGTGKTSMLLTLLAGWTGEGYNTYRGKNAARSIIPDSVKILLPILDFDPLPRGMPLHGWLLEPWRKAAKQLDANSIGSTTTEDLSELWASVFERAVIGWANGAGHAASVVEKAIAYQEKSSGWIETPKEWHDFVNAMVCRSAKCQNTDCKATHSRTFVIAIDDVDLQVEHLPQLLQAIRLLHHPNVAYILTGDHEHLQFALLLDYVKRHEHLSYKGYEISSSSVDEAIRAQIKIHSLRLRDAFLEKALPRHAQLRLETLSFQETRNLKTADGLVRDLTPDFIWNKIENSLGTRRIVAVRHAQHAIDRRHDHGHSHSADSASDKMKLQQYNFVADLCGTHIEFADDGVHVGKSKLRRQGPRADAEHSHIKKTRQFAMRGRLTTRMGSKLRVWPGDQLQVILAEQPTFAYIPDLRTDKEVVDEHAHCALLVHLISEYPDAPAAHALEWTPFDLIATTHVIWRKQSNRHDTAVFHWPWLCPPSATRVLELRTLSYNMSRLAPGNSLTHRKDELLSCWFLANIDWFEDAHLGLRSRTTSNSTNRQTLETFRRRLSSLYVNVQAVDTALAEDIVRWVRELQVMSAPYFGLPQELRMTLRAELSEFLKAQIPTTRTLGETEVGMVRNAILDGQSAGKELELRRGGAELGELAADFLEERYNTTPDDGWWKQTDFAKRLAGTAAGKGRRKNRSQ